MARTQNNLRMATPSGVSKGNMAVVTLAFTWGCRVAGASTGSVRLGLNRDTKQIWQVR